MTPGVCWTRISNTRWNSSTIDWGVAGDGSFLLIGQGLSRYNFHGTECRNLFVGRYAQFLKPAGGRQDSGLQGSDGLVIGNHAFAEGLPHVVDMLGENGHPLVEILSQSTSFL